MPPDAARKVGRAEPRARRQRDGRKSAATRPKPLGVFVVEGHELFRSGLCGLLEQRGLEVVGDAADGEAACEEVPRLDPDVVVIDLDLPGSSGVEATRQLARSAPRARIVALAIASDEPSVMRAITAGACGYLLKDAAVEDMVAAVEAAAAGESPISPRAAGSIFERLRGEGARPEKPEAPTGLTERELEVLRLLAAGKTNAKIAAALYISQPTVKHHISSIIRKLGVANRVQAAVKAVRDELV